MPDGGLITPVLKRADTTDIYQLSRNWAVCCPAPSSVRRRWCSWRLACGAMLAATIGVCEVVPPCIVELGCCPTPQSLLLWEP